MGIEYDGGIHGQKDNQEKDSLKNSLIADSKECGKLYRIRELEAADMSGDNEKICLIRMKETLSLTSIKGRNELSRVINILLNELGASDSEISVSREIVTLCQNRLDDYRRQIGLPC